MLNNKENMSKLESFMKVLTGRFDNKEQYARMQKAGKLYPYAEHVNTVCNDKIKNLPADFQGKFLVEESYYETDGKKHASAHLFLFTEEEEGFCFHLMRYRREMPRIPSHMLRCSRWNTVNSRSRRNLHRHFIMKRMASGRAAAQVSLLRS